MWEFLLSVGKPASSGVQNLLVGRKKIWARVDQDEIRRSNWESLSHADFYENQSRFQFQEPLTRLERATPLHDPCNDVFHADQINFRSWFLTI